MRSKAIFARARDTEPQIPPTAEGVASGTSATQAEAVAEIIGGVTPGGREGTRVLIVGASRKGKTTFAVSLVGALQAEGIARTILIHDCKYPDHAQYDGRAVTSLAELRRVYLDERPRVIVCRPGVSVEDAAAFVRDVTTLRGESCLLLVDEITPALRVNNDTGEPVSQVWCGPSPLWICLQGGGLGASLVVLAQLPKTVPGSLLDNAVFVFFGLGGRSLAYSIYLSLLPRDMATVVKALAPGQFVVLWPDRDWSGVVYGPS
jgi:energy-coupling factor transporter ATP-binding protein EcfA2